MSDALSPIYERFAMLARYDDAEVDADFSRLKVLRLMGVLDPTTARYLDGLIEAERERRAKREAAAKGKSSRG